MFEMTFDSTITMGSVLNPLVLLTGFAIAFTRIGGRIDLVQQTLKSHLERLQELEAAVKQIAANDVRVATMEERLNNHVKMLVTAQGDIADLRHGNGFITSHNQRHSIDGQ